MIDLITIANYEYCFSPLLGSPAYTFISCVLCERTGLAYR